MSVKITNFSTFRREVAQNYSTSPKYDTLKSHKDKADSASIQGIILNTYIKKQDSEDDFSNFDEISSSLLIPENFQAKKVEENKKVNSFDIKKALKPILIATGVGLAGLMVISGGIKKYSSHLATDFQCVPGDLPRSMNLLEEQDLAIFRALRDPNSKNILGLIGVVTMSAITMIGKKLADGVKEIWIKKQECDINKDFQENIISVETEAFSGKLNVINSLLKNTTEYFKHAFKDEKPISFKNYISFTGENKENNDNKDNKFKKLKTLGAIVASVGAFVGISYLMFKNFQKTTSNLEKFKQRMTNDEIVNSLNDAVNKKDLLGLKKLLGLINASEKTIRENIEKIAPKDEVEKIIKEVQASQIYAAAPEALAGVSEKIQYYCYVNEPRGHLYNWILNPENKFNKYLFLALTSMSAMGYALETTTDAVKTVAVAKENSNSELSLRRKLVQTEVDNFKSKKYAAIAPLMENFEYQKQKGKSKEELKQIADNILIEIKNGPPYVYS